LGAREISKEKNWGSTFLYRRGGYRTEVWQKGNLPPKIEGTKWKIKGGQMVTKGKIRQALAQ